MPPQPTPRRPRRSGRPRSGRRPPRRSREPHRKHEHRHSRGRNNPRHRQGNDHHNNQPQNNSQQQNVPRSKPRNKKHDNRHQQHVPSSLADTSISSLAQPPSVTNVMHFEVPFRPISSSTAPEEVTHNIGGITRTKIPIESIHHQTKLETSSSTSSNQTNPGSGEGQHGTHPISENRTLFITGFQATANRDKLYKMLRTFTNNKNLTFTALSHRDPQARKTDFGKAYITLDNMNDYNALLQCNGSKWGQNSLQIVPNANPAYNTGVGHLPEAVRSGPGGSKGVNPGYSVSMRTNAHNGPLVEPEKSHLFNYLCAYIEATARDGVLDFTSLHTLKAFSNFSRIINFNNNHFVSLLGHAISKSYPLAKALILTSNEMISLDPLAFLISSCINVTTVDISKNHIRDLHSLKNLIGWKLQYLYLSGNPCSVDHSAVNFSTFRDSITKIFPSLKQINEYEIQPLISFRLPAINTPADFGNYSQPGTLEVTKNFIERYFPVYDTDRQKVLHFYVENATFSLSFGVNFHINAKNLSQTQREAMSQYSKFNHNLKQPAPISGFDPNLSIEQSAQLQFSLERSAGLNSNVIDNLHTTNISATHCLLNLPKTNHDPHSFVVDSVSLPIFNSDPMTSAPIDTILVTISGVFYDNGLELHLPFSRVFVLTKASPGSPVEQIGCQSVIAADSLTIHMSTTT